MFDNSEYAIFLEESINKANNEEIGLFNTEPVTIDDECSQIYDSFRTCYANLKQKDFSDIINIDLFSDMHTKAEAVLTDLANTLKLTIDIHKLLSLFLFNATSDLPFNRDLTEVMPVQLWKRVIPNNEWEDFWKISLRIVSIGTSEADCERYISKQRLVAGDHGTNYGIQTMQSRLQVMSDTTLIDIDNI